MTLEDALSGGHDQAARSAYTALAPDQQATAAALALHHGRPGLATEWGTHDPLTRAAALLRLGHSQQALDVLDSLPDGARPALLRTRAGWQLGAADARDSAEHARLLARREGDGPALVAAATLMGEQLLPDPYAALRALAEGLKVTEMAGQHSDAHLLAVLAHVQLRLGGPKGQRTADKALERSLSRSPARVLALLALSRADEARSEAQDGQLAEVWMQPFKTDSV